MIKILEKLTNILMPMEDVMEEEEIAVKEEKVAAAVPQRERQVVNGTPYTAPAVHSRPTLTVHTTKVSELRMQIYVPTKFDQVADIADDLKAKHAAIVNYERVDAAEQRRICDFINGVCYVEDGEARRISDTMVLYVPAGVSVVEVSLVGFEK